MALSVLVFWLLALVSILGALGVVVARNPIHSAIGLVLSFLNVAAIYLVARAEFLAVVQVIVYAGAVIVLVVFVTMLVHPDDLPEFHGRRPLRVATGLILGIALLAEVTAAILARGLRGAPGPWTEETVAAVGGNTSALGQVLYSEFMLPIQLTAVLLLAATIGAIVLARPEAVSERLAVARRLLTISLAHPRGLDQPEPPLALPAGRDERVKPAGGGRPIVLARSADEFTERPAWGEWRPR
ncbi:MAG: NADH-quinone oxidoreductase subunit J [Thermomicrobium sp.]|nr:NADH-quinone oxidoreductase subunit J [Thermomicrobium sp.]MDW8059535.1 NADH-quinone oxidoreductase subunit J [Thermomicrobium sp.]